MPGSTRLVLSKFRPLLFRYYRINLVSEPELISANGPKSSASLLAHLFLAHFAPCEMAGGQPNDPRIDHWSALAVKNRANRPIGCTLSSTLAISFGKWRLMTKLHVLVIEDEPVIATLLAEVLMELGHVVSGIAATEAEAIREATRCRPDLMIVDARLRQGSGLTAVAEILRDGFIPHVFVSGDRLTKTSLSPEAIVLQKPFQEADLVRAIARALSEAKLRQQA
ncbi:response regulator [Bosea sp. 685]|uniref:response regulator n=1 Tax=Bosea sp. 685 TaxID=3080057 RepID=UPI00289380DF|nr:response regulator [Bosea sp. 685]WNJ93534.1 response regulator [Bosea sp. 685]